MLLSFIHPHKNIFFFNIVKSTLTITNLKIDFMLIVTDIFYNFVLIITITN